MYPSKLLLFGEYTIINGSRALAIPYPRYSGQWATAGEEAATRQQKLPDMLNFLSDLQEHGELLLSLDLKAFRKALAEGMFFDSNIPVGYGLGSSGALCAAIYDRFCTAKTRREDTIDHSGLKAGLAQLESFFHGSSSGTDPLVSYLNRPVLLHPGHGVLPVALPDFSSLPHPVFLLDTRQPRRTGPLVEAYLDKCRQEDFAARIRDVLIPMVNEAIGDLLGGKWPAVFRHFKGISRFQEAHFPEMITDDLRPVWQEGIQSGRFFLKLCGAGGGGFMLGIARDKAALAALEQDHPCERLFPAP